MSSFDTVVIGAGVIGLASAWRCRQLGLSVLIVERNGPASGASAVAAGMLAPITEAAFGEDALLRLNLESARRFPSFLEDLSEAAGRTISFDSDGTLYAAFDRDQLEALHRLHEFQRSLMLEVEWLSYDEVRKLEPALHPSLRGAVLAVRDSAVDPRTLTSALFDAATRAGAEVVAGTGVAQILSKDRVYELVLEDGRRLACGSAVLAAGCWSGRIEGVPDEIRETIRPVKGQILRLGPGGSEPPLTKHTVRTDDVYLVPRDGGVVVGATVEEKGFDTTLTAGGVFELLRSAVEALPGVRDLELTEAAAGLRPGTRDNAPLIGPTSIEGLCAATGHYRNGVLLAPVTADSIAELLVKGESPEEIRPFSPLRFAS